MSKTIVEYQIAYVDSHPVMSVHESAPDYVSDLLCDGWQPHGSPLVVTIHDRDYVMQAMVIYEDEQQ